MYCQAARIDNTGSPPLATVANYTHVYHSHKCNKTCWCHHCMYAKKLEWSQKVLWHKSSNNFGWVRINKSHCLLNITWNSIKIITTFRYSYIFYIRNTIRKWVVFHYLIKHLQIFQHQVIQSISHTAQLHTQYMRKFFESNRSQIKLLSKSILRYFSSIHIIFYKFFF